MKVETKRLVLRDFTNDDFNELFEILSDKKTMEHCKSIFDQTQTKDFIQTNINNCQNLGFGILAMVLKETGKVIGCTGLTLQEVDGEKLLLLEYYVNKKYWNQGFASEAAKNIVDWVFNNTQYAAIYSCIKHSNVKAYLTAIASGMEKLKEFPDEDNTFYFVYEITRLEWNAQKNENEV